MFLDLLRGTSPRWLGQQNTNQLQKLININTNQQQKINKQEKKNRNVCSLTNNMIIDFDQKSKHNLNNSVQKNPIPGANDALAIPAFAISC